MSDPAPFTPNAVYNAAETAAILRVSPDKLREIVRSGRLHPLGYSSGKLLVTGRELSRFLREETGGAK